MARLIYAAIASLDGYVADRNDDFDWAAPDEEVHTFVNDLLRPIGTNLYGRRMYEAMAAWETMPIDGEPPAMQDFAALWRASDKIVYSTTLPAVTTARTLLERAFEPAAIAALKATAAADIAISGPNLAAHALRAGLVDELHLILVPVVVGGGNPALPHDLVLHLELLDQRRFAGGTVHLHYRVGR